MSSKSVFHQMGHPWTCPAKSLSVLLLLSLLLTGQAAAYATGTTRFVPAAGTQGMASQNVRTASGASAVGLLQFTSGGHALGFTSQGMYAATGSHALHVDFVNANNVQPQADGEPLTAQGMAAPLNRVSYTDLWDGVSLTYTATPGRIYTTSYTIAPGADAKISGCATTRRSH